MSAEFDEIETLLWCMRPALDLAHLRGHLPGNIAEQAITERVFKPAAHSRFKGFFVVTETVNQSRALERLVGSGTPVPISAPTEDARVPILTPPHVAATVKRIAETLRARFHEAVIASFENQLYKVVLALAQYRAMDLTQYSGVLVSTQHSPIMRALTVASAEQSVPVVYIPHAPVASNNAYLDLPTAYAGLRGAGEISYYERELGLDPAQLDVIGNLASEMLDQPLPEMRLDAPGILALSPHSAEKIRRIFETVATPELGPMVVAPHPRSELDDVRENLPEGWTLYAGDRTLDLLTAGAPFIFQFSSGVAWESAALGIPTATIHLDDAPVNYPFLSDETVYPAIRQPSDAAEFARHARAGSVDRAGLRAHAERWCEVDGEAASDRLGALLTRVAADGHDARHSSIHDGWSASGAALSRSWIRDTSAAPEAVSANTV